jgi:hypothetical protein
MKKFLCILLGIILIVGVIQFIILSPFNRDKVVVEKPKIEIKKKDPVIKVVFIITNKNIDFEKMNIDEITDI